MNDLDVYEAENQKAYNDYEEAKRNALAKYIRNTALYSVGDILRDNTRTIKVGFIGSSSILSNVPRVSYCGIELTKAMKPNKKGNKGWITEGNINSPIILIKKGEK